MTELLLSWVESMPFVALLGFLLIRAETKILRLIAEHNEERREWRKEIIDFQEKYNSALLKGITAIEILNERVSK